MNDFNDLIFENKNALDKELCREIIRRFERDDRKSPGVTTLGEVNLDLKKSTDLNISVLDEWKDIDKIFFESMSTNFRYYVDNIFFDDVRLMNTQEAKDNGYNVKRYEPGDYFNWHVDCQASEGWVRSIAYIWYLNDIEDGETEFKSGRKIRPETGKLLMFPACWTYPHRGISPKNGNKYIVTSFISTNEQTY